KGRGLVTDELARTLTRLGFDVGRVWNHVDLAHPEQQEVQFAALHADLVKGVPSIICGWSSFGANRSEHMRLVIGYDARSDEVIYQEPAQRDAAPARLARKDFIALWTFKPAPGRGTMIRMALARNGSQPAEAPADTRAAELAQHVYALKEKAPK